jgi:hypothetical protein
LAIPTVLAPASAEKLVNEGLPPSDPLIAWGQELAPRNKFFLNSDQDVELVRFKRAHDIELCAARPDPDAIGSARHGYPIMVTWDQDTGIIAPGNCLSFEAQRVKIRPASPLPQSVELTGTVRVIH